MRHKHLDYLQRSQRYVGEDECGYVFPPEVGEVARTMMQYQWVEAVKLYKILLKRGVRKEDARFVLPQGITTELNVTGNFQAWYDFLNLRLSPHAQWEIRGLAQEIQRLLCLHAPNIFSKIGE